MNKPPLQSLLMLAVVVWVISIGQYAVAVSPATIAQGRELFERNWVVRNPAFGGDGLGPLFNGRSCVACHHQGGIGGGGDSRFNAKTISIERMRITGMVNNSVIAKLVSSFHPGFVQPNNSVVNTLTIPHHGGSPVFQRFSASVMSQVPAYFSASGGGLTPLEVRQAFATPVLFNNRIGNNEILIRARLYQRNTTPLFGAGLIDAVSEKEILAQARSQLHYPEISGRPATLKDGLIGKFGWRGNIPSLLDFVDQACANEVGLETRRKRQPRDPLNPDYRNPTTDISDGQIRAMNQFIVSLPAPVRNIPHDAADRARVVRGEQLFASVGCAVCHVPNLGPATGLYSDLLLHEMGYDSIDLNHAEPYIIRRTPIRFVANTRVTTSGIRGAKGMGVYYGGTTRIESTDVSRAYRSTGSRRARRRRFNSGYSFVAPVVPSLMMEIADFESRVLSESSETVDDGAKRTVTDESRVEESYIRLHIRPTKFNEEWRTPPLWGMRDSAPYMHDGRAETVLESIAMHDGESAGTRDRFLQLPLADRHAILAFLDTLVAPPNAIQPLLPL